LVDPRLFQELLNSRLNMLGTNLVERNAELNLEKRVHSSIILRSPNALR
jgi:hypothetical protein